MADRKDGRCLLNIADRGLASCGRPQIMKHEFRTVVFAEKWKYLIPMAIALHNCMVNFRIAGDRWEASDYIWDFLKGIPTISEGNHETFLLPGGWMFFFVLLLYFHGKTAKNFTGGMGQQALLRSGRVGRFWQAKWTGCVLSTCIWFCVAYLAVILFCAAAPDSSMWPDTRQACIQLILPVLAACAIGIWQMVLSMCAGSLMGLLGMYTLLIISGYFTRWYLPGNYLMKLRTEEMLGCGISIGRMLVFLTVMLITGVLTGDQIMKKTDYLPARSGM